MIPKYAYTKIMIFKDSSGSKVVYQSKNSKDLPGNIDSPTFASIMNSLKLVYIKDIRGKSIHRQIFDY